MIRVKKGIKFLLSIEPPLTLEEAVKTIIDSCGKPTEYNNETENRHILTYKASTDPKEFNFPYPFRLASFDEEVVFNLAPAHSDSLTRR